MTQVQQRPRQHPRLQRAPSTKEAQRKQGREKQHGDRVRRLVRAGMVCEWSVNGMVCRVVVWRGMVWHGVV
jgi:hypothetical protein